MHRYTKMSAVAVLAIATTGLGAGAQGRPGGFDDPRRPPGKVRPGISVLFSDSSLLVDGKRVGLLTNQTGVDEKGVSDIDLFVRRGTEKGVTSAPKLVQLFAPEHGIRGTEDKVNLANGVDARTGIPIYSLYGATTLAPPDSILRKLDVLAIDLQDLGARDWTYVATMVYAMRAAAAAHIPVLVLDRPNPITGSRVEGPILDTNFAYAGSHSATRAATPTALYPIPMRHGLTMGELARFYNNVLDIHADLHVIPMANWRRDQWFNQTKLPWIKPSPNMPNLASATVYPGVVWLEATNVSVGRGTSEPFLHIGAPWMNAKKVVDLLKDRALIGVKFEEERFTPVKPTDDKYGGVSLHGVHIIVTDRDRLSTSRLGATLLWAIAKANGDSLRFQKRGMNELFGVKGGPELFLSGADPDSLIDASLPGAIGFQEATKRYRLYK